VLQALKTLGFRDGPAQRAVATVERVPGADPPIEQALRAALKALADAEH
jgi:Holliday junction resolvasome RuvABC DNA-binding subunit